MPVLDSNVEGIVVEFDRFRSGIVDARSMIDFIVESDNVRIVHLSSHIRNP